MGMIRKNLALLVALVAFSATAQTAISASDLENPTGLLGWEAVKAMSWNLTFNPNSSDYQLASADSMSAAVMAGTEFDWPSDSYRLLAWHFRDSVAQSVRAVNRLGGYDGGYLSSDLGPVAFFQHEGEFGMLLSGVGVGVSLNTFNSSELERARRMVYEFITPALARVARPFNGTSVRWVGVSLTYGAEDFTARSVWYPPEMTIVIVSVADALAFDQLSITDTELVSRGLVLTGTPASVRRVDLGR